MARPARPDLIPEILIRDTQEEQRRAQEAAGRNVRIPARLKHIDDDNVKDGFLIRFDELGRRLSEIERSGTCVPYSLLNYLLQHIQKLEVREQRFTDAPSIPPGMVQVKLVRVGCRVGNPSNKTELYTHNRIAGDLGVARTTVTQWLDILRKNDVICNWGKGWIEFSADLVWRGPLAYQAEYAKVQALHPTLHLNAHPRSAGIEDDENV